jgi:methionyl-tRNA formyltransferase
MEGVTETGVTLFKIDKGLDTGDVVASVPTKIEPVENAGALLQRLTGLGVSLLLEQLPKISSGLVSLTPQKEFGASLAAKISRVEAEINFNRSAKQIENITRGCNPEPGAWTKSNQGYDLKIHIAWACHSSFVDVGHVSTEDGRVFVGCEDQTLELVEVQPAGKSRMSAADWVRGTTAPVVLGSIE